MSYINRNIFNNFNKLVNFPILNGFIIGILSLLLLNPNFEIINITLNFRLLTIISAFLILLLTYGLIKSKGKFSSIGIGLSLIILFFSNTLNNTYSLLHGPIIKGEILLFFLIFFVLLINNKQKYIYKILLLSPIILAAIFLFESKQNLVWSDDNPTFSYRLEALKRFFPNIPFYFTGWNSGLDARDFFATGALNIFFLAYPIIKILNITKHYNIILIYLLFILLPLFNILAAKILKKDFKFIAIVSVLSVTNSLFWYRWALKYGTLGFITSTSLAPLVFVLASKLLSKNENLSKNEAILLVVTTSLLLLWSAAGLIFIPCILLGIIFLNRLLKKKYVCKIILSLMLINIPWIIIFFSASNVGNFIKAEKSTELVNIETKINSHNNQLTNNLKIEGEKTFKTKATSITLSKSLKILRETLIGVNPIIYLFVLTGIFLLPNTYKNTFILTFIWLLFLGTAYSQVKPQMELDRMLIVLSILSIIPCAFSLEELTKLSFNKYTCLLNALILSFIFTGILSTGSILKNRTVEVYYRQNDSIKNLINFLKNYESKGRILFSGFVLHDFGGGHIAPLPFMTGKQLIASSPFHNVWKYTEVIPKEFLREDYKIENYLKLQNVELVIAHEKYWRDYFLNNINFEEIYKFNNYKIFKYKNFSDSYILTGKIKNIEILDNKINLTPLSKDIVLKFNYFPFLKTNNCKISNESVSESINFIKLSDCDIGKATTIKAKNAFLRVFKK